jgi:hypothetical protein
MNDNYAQVDKSTELMYIVGQLYQTLEFKTLFLYVLGVYDEENDCVKFYETLKVSLLYIIWQKKKVNLTKIFQQELFYGGGIIMIVYKFFNQANDEFKKYRRLVNRR